MCVATKEGREIVGEKRVTKTDLAPKAIGNDDMETGIGAKEEEIEGIGTVSHAEKEAGEMSRLERNKEPLEQPAVGSMLSP